MKKAILIGLIVVVLALGAIGAAFATNANFTNVGALSLGWEPVGDVDVDYIGYELATYSPGLGEAGVEVDGVYISFAENIHSVAPNHTVIFVSLRAADWTELAYCVACVEPSTTLLAGKIYKFKCADGTTANPQLVAFVKVMVAEQSAYSHNDTDHCEGAGVLPMPGVMGQ